MSELNVVQTLTGSKATIVCGHIHHIQLHYLSGYGWQRLAEEPLKAQSGGGPEIIVLITAIQTPIKTRTPSARVFFTLISAGC